MERGSGVLLAVSSLPGDFGIGTLGQKAYDFIDFLVSSGQKYWQILPLTETGMGGSPYQSVSAFAGNINYIDFDLLYEDGLLTESELSKCRASFAESDLADIDGQSVKEELLYPAFKKGFAKYKSEIDAFCRENGFWIGDFALYKAIAKNEGASPALYEKNAGEANALGEKYREDVDFYIFTQYLFSRQWQAVKKYANDRGIKIIGDMPFYVSADSADIWSHGEWFSKTDVAGCPPDYFCEDGQKWGNPVYDWEKLRQNGYGFWIERFAHAFRLFDLVRVDHFRGFEAFWTIPKEEPAVKGHWEKGPGKPFFDMLKAWFGKLPLIAEDLGTLTDSFFEFMRDCGFPGLKVLEFAFSPYENSIYLPHNHIKNAVVYTGTHDNDTVKGWYGSLKKAEKDYLCAYIGVCTEKNIAEKMINTAYSSVCDVCIIPMQDILNEDGSKRMNAPGTVGGINWRYRVKSTALSQKLAEKLLEKVKIYSR